MMAFISTISAHYIFVGVAVLLLISVLASKTSQWFGLPALLVFMAVGMLAGSEGPGGIYFDDPNLGRFLGTVALAYIIFSGGLSTSWHSARPVLRMGAILATVGVFLTAALVGTFAMLLLGFTWKEGLLLGAIISSTDAAAVFSILRSRNISLRGRLRPLLELESGSNDPMAVFLTITVIVLLGNPEASWLWAVPAFLWQMVLGGLLGWLLGKAIVYLVNRVNLDYEGLYPVMMLASVLLVFGVTELLRGNGFLAVYITGMVIGNSTLLHKQSLIRFHDGLAWLMQIAMFLTLGLLVFPSHLVPVIGSGLAVAAFLMIVARPVATFLCLLGTRLTFRERLLVSWVGLRGAVPIVLATFPLTAGLPRAEEIFNLVFFVVIASVLLQGKSLQLVARWLKLDAPLRSWRRHPLEVEQTGGSIRAAMVEVTVPPGSEAAGRRILDLKLPAGALVVLVYRSGEYLVPGGRTALRDNDTLLVLAEPDTLAAIRQILSVRDEGGPD